MSFYQLNNIFVLNKLVKYYSKYVFLILNLRQWYLTCERGLQENISTTVINYKILKLQYSPMNLQWTVGY